MNKLALHHFARYSALAAAVSASVFAAPAMAEEASFDVYGFAQADYVQDFKRVDPKWKDTLRASKIPTTEGKFGSDGQAVISARQSRLGVQATLPIEGQSLYTKFEFDMFGVGDDVGENTIRLRHAYGEYGHWLAGQTNTLFMDADLFPNTIDYWGPAGMVFIRNPQIRWTPVKGDSSFAIAIESPYNDVSNSGTSSLQGDSKLPDFTAQYRSKQDWGHFQIAGILRSLAYETTASGNDPSDSTLGWGVDLSSNFKFGTDTLRLGVVHGNGIGNYLNDGGGDNDLATNGVDVDAVPLTGIIAYYDHAWDEKWTSAIGYSTIMVDNSELHPASAYSRVEYASVNLLKAVNSKMMMGGELLYGTRTDNSGADGNDVRVQFSMKYSFSSKDFGR
jgi:hypothetical protein